MKFFTRTPRLVFQLHDLVSWKLCEVKQRTERLVCGYPPIGVREIESRSVRCFFSDMADYGIIYFCPASARSSVTLMI